MDEINTHVHITMRHLQEQVEQLKEMKSLLCQLIAPEISQHIEVAKILNQTLTLMADNASIATHIKLIVPQLIEGLHNIAPELKITAIKCKVSKPRGDMVISTPRVATLISEQSAQGIKEAAQGIQYERLKKALEKLSGN